MQVDFQKIQEDLNEVRETTAAIREQLNLLPLPVAEEKPLTVTETAEFFGVAEQTIYQNIKHIPHRKRFGRLYFLKAELIAFLDGKEVSHDQSKPLI